MANRLHYLEISMRDIKEQWKYPKGIKKFIYDNTDFQTNKTLKKNRFVVCIEMFNGKPIERVFGFLSKSNKRTYKDIQVKEVARYYEHNQYLGGVWCNYVSGAKYCNFGESDRFYKYNKHIWYFPDEYLMTNLNQFLIDNNLKYTGWEQYKGGIGFTEYITTYIENPKIELLVKAGLDKWVRYMRYLDTSKKAIHEVFKINQNCVPLLYEDNFGLEELFICRKTKSNDLNFLRNKVSMKYKIIDLRKWYGGNNEELINVLKQEKTVKYISDNKVWQGDYIDYLRDLIKLGAITDIKALYPKNFVKAHRQANKKVKIVESQELVEGFIKAYNKHKKYVYEDSNFLIKPVKDPMELYKESEVLGHCVRSYDTDVSDGKTEIMFIRKTNSQNKPFFTLELKRKRIIQVRGKKNKEPNNQVKAFVEEWANKYKLKYDKELIEEWAI